MSDLEVVAVGSALVDRLYALSNLPEPDGGAFVRGETTAFGGVAANVASALARLGRDAGVVSRVGDDADGDRVLADLRERGVDASRVRRGDEPTSYSMILRDPDGERMIVAGGESVPNLRLREGDYEYLRRADVIFTSAYAPDRVTRELAAAHTLPPLVCDLPGPLSELDGRATRPATIDDLAAHCDLLVMNEVSARSYLDAGPRGSIRELRERGVRRAAITRGADGALLFDGAAVTEIDAFEVDVVDTTGAGDAFTAGLIHAWLLEGQPAAEAGRFAAATAACNCTAEGARGGLASASDVRSFLDSR
ncbi:carbohydrate kinase family protein [Halalkalicoccus subterraneus]|uniref:carbohydrate kinase family protein n=1 Tax=Halalkalicoccus subterraneus TaxID=2675002 RepID=UPI000EFD19BE|nr:carbohydrate kinase family protein [Halalkalicoccus subterraneus]